MKYGKKIALVALFLLLGSLLYLRIGSGRSDYDPSDEETPAATEYIPYISAYFARASAHG